MDLPKFPRHLRMDMAKEIGRSKMNKISLGKQNQLLKFALRYTVSLVKVFSSVFTHDGMRLRISLKNNCS